MGVASSVTSHGDEALQEYLDLLLKPESAAGERPRAERTPADRPYAEPSRALRMPLPPLAPPRVETSQQDELQLMAAAVVAAEVVVAPEEAVVAAEETMVAAETVAKAPPVVQPPVAPAEVPVVEPASAVVDASPTALRADALQPAPWADSLQPAPWAENGRPHWAHQRFEVLLFSVGGLKLAVPLVELGAIHALEGRELTPIFGQVDWFLGILPLKEGSLRVIDTAKVVMPERYDAAMPGAYRYVITLNGSDWGLGVDTIHDSTQLLPEAVRWRGARGKRPWLAGTVIEQMCALVDAAQLTWMFHNLDRRRGGKGGGGTARL